MASEQSSNNNLKPFGIPSNVYLPSSFSKNSSSKQSQTNYTQNDRNAKKEKHPVPNVTQQQQQHGHPSVAAKEEEKQQNDKHYTMDASFSDCGSSYSTTSEITFHTTNTSPANTIPSTTTTNTTTNTGTPPSNTTTTTTPTTLNNNITSLPSSSSVSISSFKNLEACTMTIPFSPVNFRSVMESTYQDLEQTRCQEETNKAAVVAVVGQQEPFTLWNPTVTTTKTTVTTKRNSTCSKSGSGIIINNNVTEEHFFGTFQENNKLETTDHDNDPFLSSSSSSLLWSSSVSAENNNPNHQTSTIGVSTTTTNKEKMIWNVSKATMSFDEDLLPPLIPTKDDSFVEPTMVTPPRQPLLTDREHYYYRYYCVDDDNPNDRDDEDDSDPQSSNSCISHNLYRRRQWKTTRPYKGQLHRRPSSDWEIHGNDTTTTTTTSGPPSSGTPTSNSSAITNIRQKRKVFISFHSRMEMIQYQSQKPFRTVSRAIVGSMQRLQERITTTTSASTTNTSTTTTVPLLPSITSNNKATTTSPSDKCKNNNNNNSTPQWTADAVIPHQTNTMPNPTALLSSNCRYQDASSHSATSLPHVHSVHTSQTDGMHHLVEEPDNHEEENHDHDEGTYPDHSTSTKEEDNDLRWLFARQQLPLSVPLGAEKHVGGTTKLPSTTRMYPN